MLSLLIMCPGLVLRRKLSLSRKLPCTKCNGTGSKSGKRHTCSTCQGSGVQVHIRPLGPGMVQQIQSRCSDCQGSGYSSIPSECRLLQSSLCAASGPSPACCQQYKSCRQLSCGFCWEKFVLTSCLWFHIGDRCTACSGNCLVSEKKTFEVAIEPGMKNGQKITLHGEAGCTEPGLQPGDVILVLQQKEHDVFTRLPNPADIIFEKHISLKDALCGCRCVAYGM